MARVSSIITNFRAGEISPKLEGRIDLQKYNEAAQTLNNMLVYPSGGVTRRPGTFFAGRSKDGGKVRLMNFEFSDEQAYVLEMGENYIPRYIAVGPKQIEDLLGTTQVTSSDFNTVKALVSGDVDTFMGFRFIMSNRLAVSATDVRTCFAWAEDGLTLGMGKDISARIDERADKGYATQVYYCMSIGAVRMEENKVCQIFCDETPD